MMSKQTAIILILVVFLGALGALIYFYFTFNASPVPKAPAPIASVDIYDPFGNNATPNIISTSTTPAIGTPDTTDIIVELSKLRKISDEPISGFSVVENTKTKITDIHYILRSNGNIYETYSNSPEQKRLSITTIPKVYESMWLPDGQNLIIRYLKGDTETIDTFSVKIKSSTSTLNEFEGGVDGNHLADNISGIAINPLGDKIFYLTNNINGSSGFISKPDGLNKKLIFESPLVEWLVSWPKEETITLTTKPTAKIPGHMYFLNSQTGNFSRIISGVNGLTTKTNKTATEVLYADSLRGTPKLYFYNVKTNESKLLPWSTLPTEKCLWSNTDAKIVYCAVPKSFPDGEYPDLWYQGLASFTDDIWRINTDTMASTLVFDIQKETNNNIDIIDIQIDKNDNNLYFINKTDLSFWSLDLK